MNAKFLIFLIISFFSVHPFTAPVNLIPNDHSRSLISHSLTPHSLNTPHPRRLGDDENEEVPGETTGEGGEPAAGFDAEAEEKSMSEALILEVPKAFTCEDAEKMITCKDATKEHLTFKIKYKAQAIGSGGGKKKIMYTVTVSNGLSEGQDTREFHGTYRVKFEKDEKGVNLKQKMAWIFGSAPSNDLNRPNFINDLRRIDPIDMAMVKTHPKVNELVKLLFSTPQIIKGDKSLSVRGPCVVNPQTTCLLTMYPIDASYMRAQVQVGRASSNFAIPLSNFNDVFPIYGNAILRFATTEVSIPGGGFPLNLQMAKSQMVNGLTAICGNMCTWGTETDQAEANFNLFSKPFVFKRQTKSGVVDEKYTVVGLYYNFEGWNYQHILLDSDKQQEEIMLNTNSVQFLPTFQSEMVEFFRSNDYSNLNLQGEVALTIEDLLNACQASRRARVDVFVRATK